MKTIKSLGITFIMLLMLAVLPLQSVAATDTAIFNSIPDPLPGNLLSQATRPRRLLNLAIYQLCWDSSFSFQVR